MLELNLNNITNKKKTFDIKILFNNNFYMFNISQ